MHSVTNLSNNKMKEIVKLHQKKYRDELGLFIAEGYKCVQELIESNIQIQNIFALKNFNSQNIKIPLSIIDEATMKKISTTDTVCEIIAIAKKKEIELNSFKELNTIVLLDSISDPGNLGTIIRSASAFGIDGIILYGNCVDLYSPKVIRSSTGNLFKTPIVQIKEKSIIDDCLKNHIKIATALSEKNNISLSECSKIEKKVIMFGSEATGLSTELINSANKNIRIEMTKNVESLNIAITASIIFYELFQNL